MSKFTLRRDPVQRKLGLTVDPRRDFRDLYQPARLDELQGQEDASRVLRSFLTAPYPTVFLFSGPTGAGKTTAGHILVNELGVDKAANLFWVKSGELTKETLEDVQKQFRFPPWGSDQAWRVVLVDEADTATARAKELLLSLLERLPERTLFVLTTNHPERFDRRTLDRFKHVPFTAEPGLTRDGAQALVDHIWSSETGGTDGPDLDQLPDVIIDGQLSFRRIADRMQSIIRDGARLLPRVNQSEPVRAERADPPADFWGAPSAGFLGAQPALDPGW